MVFDWFFEGPQYILDYEKHDPDSTFISESETEWVEEYRPGGFHPVDIGDLIDGRFEVFHKLGAGAFGVVWMCLERQTQKWRALKILVARFSNDKSELEVYEYLRSQSTPEELERNHIAAPLEHFHIDGPNGRHLCFVLPVLGSEVSQWIWDQDPLKEGTSIILKDVCRQLAQGVRFLHRNGVIHGDIKPTNIMLKLSGIDGLTKDEMGKLLGKPEMIPIETTSGSDPGPHAPRYYVSTVDGRWCKALNTTEIVIIDYTESCLGEDPHPYWGTPIPYAAPEVVFPKSLPGADGYSKDVWSLACTMYEIKTKHPMFESCDFPYTLVEKLELYFGPLPEVYLVAWNHAEDCDRKRNAVSPDEGKPFDDLHYVTWKPTELKPVRDRFLNDSGCSDPLEGKLLRERCQNNLVPGKRERETIKYRYPREDTLLLADLLHGMFKYNPEDRLSMEDVCRHPWLQERTRFQAIRNALKPCIPEILRQYSVLAFGLGVAATMAAVFWTRLGDSQQGHPTPVSASCPAGLHDVPANELFLVPIHSVAMPKSPS